MSPVSRGFHGRRRIPVAEEDRVPPGQHVTMDFPVLLDQVDADAPGVSAPPATSSRASCSQ